MKLDLKKWTSSSHEEMDMKKWTSRPRGCADRDLAESAAEDQALRGELVEGRGHHVVRLVRELQHLGR